MAYRSGCGSLTSLILVMRAPADTTKVAGQSQSDSKSLMTASSLVPCPTCQQRRELVSVEPTGPKKDGAEIRIFACRTCGSEARYVIQRRVATLLGS